MLTLDGAARLWPTPDASQGQGYNQSDSPGAAVRPQLAMAAKLWPTPRASENENRTTQHAPSHGHGHGKTLAGEAMSKLWPTPRAEDSESCGNHPGASDSLTGETRRWRTPSSCDWKGESAKSWRDRDSGDTTPTLADQVADLYSRHTPPRRPRRKRGKPICERSRVLNPRFVEALMGWPMGWSIASTGSACSVTASYLTRPPSASFSSTNASAEVA